MSIESPTPAAPVIGLTGGIGSGKSAAADCFAALGVTVVDTDAISHELTAAGGAAMPAILATFGSAMLTAEGALNRIAMRQRVFTEPAARLQLEAILHPLIRETSQRRVELARQRMVSTNSLDSSVGADETTTKTKTTMQQGGRAKDALCAVACDDTPYVVLVVPLLVESKNYRERVNRVLVIDCPEETQITRTMARSAMSRDEVLRVLASQATRAQRLAAADDVIDNDGSLAQLQQRVAALDAAYRANRGSFPTKD